MTLTPPRGPDFEYGTGRMHFNLMFVLSYEKIFLIFSGIKTLVRVEG
jgi:hypothetical protein